MNRTHSKPTMDPCDIPRQSIEFGPPLDDEEGVALCESCWFTLSSERPPSWLKDANDQVLQKLGIRQPLGAFRLLYPMQSCQQCITHEHCYLVKSCHPRVVVDRSEDGGDEKPAASSERDETPSDSPGLLEQSNQPTEGEWLSSLQEDALAWLENQRLSLREWSSSSPEYLQPSSPQGPYPITPQNGPSSPALGPSPPRYEPQSPVYRPVSPIQWASPSSYGSQRLLAPQRPSLASPEFRPVTPQYRSSSPEYKPASPLQWASPDSPEYQRLSTPQPSSPVCPTIRQSLPVYQPSIPYQPFSPLRLGPSSPEHQRLLSPEFRPDSPTGSWEMGDSEMEDVQPSSSHQDPTISPVYLPQSPRLRPPALPEYRPTPPQRAPPFPPEYRPSSRWRVEYPQMRDTRPSSFQRAPEYPPQHWKPETLRVNDEQHSLLEWSSGSSSNHILSGGRQAGVERPGLRPPIRAAPVFSEYQVHGDQQGRQGAVGRPSFLISRWAPPVLPSYRIRAGERFGLQSYSWAPPAFPEH